MYRLTAGLVSCVLLLFAVTACGGGKEITKTEEKDVLKILRSDKFEILDPQGTSSGGDVAVLAQMYEGLIRPPATDGSPVTTPKWEPSLATKWDISTDAKTYTFTLRQGVKFHDGAEFNSDAVKKSFERLILKDHPAQPTEREYAEQFAAVDKIEAVDASTVRFSLKRSDPRLLANLSIHAAYIISPKAIAAMSKMGNPGDRQGWLTKNSAGTGPFRVARPEDYRSAESMTLTAFDDYWGGKPKISIVTLETVPEHKTRREQLVNGAAQFTDSLVPSDWDEVRSNKAVVLFTWEAINLCYLALNCDSTKSNPTKDRRVREAIALSINRDPIIQRYYGAAKAAHVLLPYTSPFGFPKDYKPKSDTLSREEALTKAKQLLKEAGAEGATLRFRFPVVSRPYLLYPQETADLIRQQLESVGFKIEPQPAQSVGELISTVQASDYSLMLLGWMGDTGEPDNFWSPLLDGADGKSGPLNLAHFYDAGVHTKVDAAGREPDTSKRDKMYKELEMSVHDEFRPIVPLLTSRKSFVWSSKLKGVRVDTGDQFYLDKAYYEK